MGSSGKRDSSRARRGQSVERPSQAVSGGFRRALTAELGDIALRLGGVYSTCVTVGLALARQNGDQDGDIARCLRLGAGEPVSTQVARINALAVRVGAGRREVLP